jgi:hypothetical protein
MKKSGSIIRALTGILIAVAAVALLLNNTGVIDLDTVVNTWWPLAVVLAGVWFLRIIREAGLLQVF